MKTGGFAVKTENMEYFLLSGQNVPFCGEGDDLKRNILTAVLQSPSGSCFNTAAAGNFHSDYSNALNIIFDQNVCEFFGIIDVIQFGAAYQNDFSPEKLLVEV